MTGKTIGNWTVLLRTNQVNRRDPIWKCLCVCGTTKLVSGNSLRNGSRSCGCSKKENKGRPKKNPDFVITNNVMARYKVEAKNRNLQFQLSREEFVDFIKQKCFYCDSAPSCFQNNNAKNFTLHYNGIDRVDNDKGYILSNCVTCCKSCNSKKKATSADMIYKAYHFLFKST